MLDFSLLKKLAKIMQADKHTASQILEKAEMGISFSLA